MSLPLKFDHYYLYDEMTQALQEMAGAYPGLCKLSSIGKSPQGRDIWAMGITNLATGDFLEKPAYYIDGNHHAGEVTGNMVSTYAIHRLLTDYGTCPKTTALLDTHTVYVIPRISPDGAETYLTTPETLRSSPQPYPFEKKAPGLHGEDVNGDGAITMMRMKSPLGQWKKHPEDPRVMTRRAPDDFGGEYYVVLPEGTVEDCKGVDIYEAVHKSGLDFNRNYPFGWFPEYRQPGAGNYPLSNPENRAVADFIIGHPNIGGAATMHTTGGVIAYPPGTYSLSKAPKRDAHIFKEIGKMGTEETGYPIANVFDDFLSDTVNYSSGALDDYMYEYYGIPAYTVELWDLESRAGVTGLWPKTEKTDSDRAGDYVKVMKWIDENLGAEGFADWTPFDHPQLGAVEIGGFKFKFAYQNCPPKFLEAECEKNYRFCLRHANTLPLLKVDSLEAKPAGEGVFHIKAVVANHGYLATFLTQAALNVKVDKAVKATLGLPEGASVVMGEVSCEIGHLEGFGGKRAHYSYHGIALQKGEYPASRAVEWVVQAKAGDVVTVTFAQPKGGVAKAEIKL